MMIRLRTRLILPFAFCTLAAMLAGPLPAQDAEQPAAAAPADPVGYFIGMSIGQNLLQQGFQAGDFTSEGMVQGIADALAEKQPALSEEQMQQISGNIREMMQQRQEAMARTAGTANMEQSKLFLEENAKKEGVKTLDSGLQYKVLSSGQGQSPAAEDVVRVHYTGTLIDGTKFDSSVDRGEPAEFAVGQVIAGWTEALQKMKVGDKWMLYVPPQLGYGEQGAGGIIGPNQTLIFEVELLDILR